MARKAVEGLGSGRKESEHETDSKGQERAWDWAWRSSHHEGKKYVCQRAKGSGLRPRESWGASEGYARPVAHSVAPQGGKERRRPSLPVVTRTSRQQPAQ